MKHGYYLNEGVYSINSHSGELVSSLPPGVYEFGASMMGELWLKEVTISSDSLIRIEGSITDKVMKDLENFWNPSSRQAFEEFGFTYKRGILLHGRPGSGKSATINMICEAFVKRGGVVLFDAHPGHIPAVSEHIRKFNPDTPILCVFEDFEGMAGDQRFLAVLDGQTSVDNIIYLASTNYIDRIPDNLKKRPSRFALVLEVGEPAVEIRRAFIEKKLPERFSKDVDELVEATGGMILDEVKAVLLTRYCLGQSLEEAVALFKGAGPEPQISEVSSLEDIALDAA